MFRYAAYAFLVPAAARGAAFAWAPPEPTLVIPEADGWSPAPTKAPEVGAIELFRRAGEAQGGVCGYLSGQRASSITCRSSGYICATHTFLGVQGCCAPDGLDSCTIPTTCIPSTQMSASCTDSGCSSNDYIAKCTASEAPECYEYHFVYASTTMVQHGCDASGFTMSVEPIEGGPSSTLPSGLPVTVTVKETVTPSDTTSPAADAPPQEAPKKKTPIGAVVGGTVGGCILISVIAFVIFYRRHKNKTEKKGSNARAHRPEVQSPAVTEYDPYGFPPTFYPAAEQGREYKAWQQQQCTTDELYGASSNPALQYPGAVQYGAVEAAGHPIRLYEAPN